MSKADRKNRELNRGNFEKHYLPEFSDMLKEMTKGVYRCQELEFDLYPGPNYARFYKTGERTTFDAAIQLMKDRQFDKVVKSESELREERNKLKLALYEALFTFLIKVEEGGEIAKFINYCCGEENTIKLVFSQKSKKCIEELMQLQGEE